MSLTEDDKKWLTALLERFATKQDLETKLERYATKEDLERLETNLLTEFHKWATPTEARLRTHTATLRAIDLEMEAMSERIGNLEGPGAS